MNPNTKRKKIAILAVTPIDGGGFTVFSQLIPRLVKKYNKQNDFFVFLNSDIKNKEFTNQIDSLCKVVTVNNRIGQSTILRLIWEQVILPFYLEYLNIDAVLALTNTLPLFDFPRKNVLVFQNSNPFSFLPMLWSKRQRIRNFLLKRLMSLSMKRSSNIVFLSQSSFDICSTTLSFVSRKGVVIPWGRPEYKMNSEGHLKIQGKTRGPESNKPYIFNCSMLYPHKNIERLILAFNIICQEFGYLGNLLIAGSVCSPKYYQSLISLCDSVLSRSKIHFLGLLNKEEVLYYMQCADLYVMPSLEETFGLPLLEAMELGIPIAASGNVENGPYCFTPSREICQDAADYFNPFDVKSMAEVMRRIIFDKSFHTQLSHAGQRRAQFFDWENTTEAIMALLV